MYQDMIKAFNKRIKKHSEELIAKGIFSQDFDITSQEDEDKIIRYENNIAYRIYRNIITIPRQGIARGCSIFLLLELLVLLVAFIIGIYPSETWWVVKMAFKIAVYLGVGAVICYTLFICVIISEEIKSVLAFLISRLFRWFDNLMDSFVDEGIPALLNIFQWVMFGWLVKILFETLL